jgi:MFS family permease
VILSPYFGPLFTAFILSTQKWNWGFWLLAILTGICLVSIVLFVDETFYNRHLPPPPRHSRFQRLLGIEQWKSRHRRSTFKEAFMRPWKVAAKPTVFLSMFYYCFTFAWVVGINTTLSIFVTPLYNFGLKQIGTSSFPFPLSHP